MKNIKKFTIDFNTWGKQALLTTDGKMCCLGFYSKARGVSNDDMRYVGSWSDLNLENNFLCQNQESTKIEKQLINVNDSKHLSVPFKIKTITKLFKENDIHVNWQNVPKEKLKFLTRAFRKQHIVT
ncbi:MAG: hypothetical protein AABY22_36580 [Nanoarchaeota archaeon]